MLRFPRFESSAAVTVKLALFLPAAIATVRGVNTPFCRTRTWTSRSVAGAGSARSTNRASPPSATARPPSMRTVGCCAPGRPPKNSASLSVIVIWPLPLPPAPPLKLAAPRRGVPLSDEAGIDTVTVSLTVSVSSNGVSVSVAVVELARPYEDWPGAGLGYGSKVTVLVPASNVTPSAAAREMEKSVPGAPPENESGIDRLSVS